MDMPVKKREFPHTAAALAQFDAGVAARQLAWSTVQTNADAEQCDFRDKLALRAVQDAFHLDTHDINSLEHCRLVDEAFMRRMTEGS
jgi:hypothetical protein